MASSLAQVGSLAGQGRSFQCLDDIAPRRDQARVRLVVFHYHDRPGGVRQVISRGLPQLATRLGTVAEVVLVLGELTDPDWLRGLEASFTGMKFRIVVHRDFGYLSGAAQELSPAARALILDACSGKNVLVWAHNLSVGRNVPLLLSLPGWCAAAGATLWLHHHDWWWDGRWARWQDWCAAGVPVSVKPLTFPCRQVLAFGIGA